MKTLSLTKVGENLQRRKNVYCSEMSLVNHLLAELLFLQKVFLSCLFGGGRRVKEISSCGHIYITSLVFYDANIFKQ